MLSPTTSDAAAIRSLSGKNCKQAAGNNTPLGKSHSLLLLRACTHTTGPFGVLDPNARRRPSGENATLCARRFLRGTGSWSAEPTLRSSGPTFHRRIVLSADPLAI